MASAEASCLQTLEDELTDEDAIEEIDSELLVRETFKNLFPDSFDGVLPVRKHKARPTYRSRSPLVP